jgi:hypothetical protein
MASFITNAESPILMQPRQGALHDPTKHAQATAVLGVALGQNRNDPTLTESLAMRLGIVGAVSLDALGAPPRRTGFAADRWDSVYERQQLGNVMPVRPRGLRGQGDAVAVGDEVMFRAFLAAIGGVGSGVRPPKTARTEAESTTAWDQSILSAPFRCASRSWCSSSQTPAFCQSRKRRQQVMPQPQPISWGRYSQGIPVFNTKRMPVRASRLPTGLRPGWRNRRGLALGKIGSMRDHNSSSRIVLAMSAPPCSGMTYTDRLEICLDPFC